MNIVKVKYSRYKKGVQVEIKEEVISQTSQEVVDMLKEQGAFNIKVTSVKPIITFY